MISSLPALRETKGMKVSLHVMWVHAGQSQIKTKKAIQHSQGRIFCEEMDLVVVVLRFPDLGRVTVEGVHAESGVVDDVGRILHVAPIELEWRHSTGRCRYSCHSFRRFEDSRIR